MAGKKHKHEDHLNHEAWAIPYGDLITLLLAFFVVMYAISSVNEGKYRALSNSLTAAFHGPPRRLKPIELGEKPKGNSNGPPVVSLKPKPIDMSPSTSMGDVPANNDNPIDAIPIEPPEPMSVPDSGISLGLSKMANDVEKAMSGLIEKGLVTVRRSRLWLEIEIKTQVLFPSGVASISPPAVPVIGRLANILKPFPNSIRVEGHTDNIPIHTSQFPSNWELSAARAASVVEQFQKRGVDPGRMAVVGFGKFRPEVKNDTPENRGRNRRVLIVVMAVQPIGPKKGASPGLEGMQGKIRPPQRAPKSPVEVAHAAAASGGHDDAAGG